MISSSSEPGTPQKEQNPSVVLLSSESEPGTPEKLKNKKPRGRYIVWEFHGGALLGLLHVLEKGDLLCQ